VCVTARARQGVTKLVKNFSRFFLDSTNANGTTVSANQMPFSKKVENHAAAVALYFMDCNFGRIYQILRVTPAMVAGVATGGSSVEEIVGLLP
jgi:hypothetical protein